MRLSSPELPVTIDLHRFQLAILPCGSTPNGCSAWRRLRRMLSGVDVAAVCWRRDESPLGGHDLTLRTDREALYLGVREVGERRRACDRRRDPHSVRDKLSRTRRGTASLA